MGSLVDPSYELIDPTPDVHALFCQFDSRFFDGKLAACEVKWSPRMTTCAGICCYEVRSGLCSIRLSTPLLKLRPRKDLIETLLHEMIHAFLFVTVRDRDRDGHGPQFQWHMHRINNEAGTRISIYHSFHAEVAVYKNHHWRCEGPCRERRPFFGWVKRASNRAPSKNDLWWAEHERSCGGKFVKVSEPKEFTEKREKAERKKVEGGGEKKRGGASTKGGGAKTAKTDDAVEKKQPRIDAVFGGGGGGAKLGSTDGNAVKIVAVGGGTMLGGSTDGNAVKTVAVGGGTMLGGGAGRSRLLDLFGGDGKRSTVDSGNRSDADIIVIEPTKERPRLRGGSDRSLEKQAGDGGKENRSDDDIAVIEPTKERPRLRGGSARTPEKDADKEDSDVFVVDGGWYLPYYDDNNLQLDHMDDDVREEPEEIPTSPNRRRRYDIAIYESTLAEMSAKVNALFEGGEEGQAFALMGECEGINAQLAELKDEEIAWKLHENEKKAKEEDDERVLRKIRGEETVEEEKGHEEYWQPETALPQPPSTDVRRLRERIDWCEKHAAELYMAADNYSDEGEEEMAMVLRRERAMVMEELDGLLDQEEVWRDHEDAETAKGEETDRSVRQGRRRSSDQDASFTGREGSFDEEKENRGKEEEEEEDSSLSGRKTRKERRMIEDTEDEYEESDEEVQGEKEEPKEEEKGEEMEMDEGEVEMEEVSIVRRQAQTWEMAIGDWMLLPIPAAAAPVDVSVGEMERRRPRVRRQWQKMVEQWRIRQEQRVSGETEEPAAAAPDAAGQPPEDDSESDFWDSLMGDDKEPSTSDKKKTTQKRRARTRRGRFVCEVGVMHEGKEYRKSPHSSDNDEPYEPPSKRGC